jgi:hypothetical protein
MAVWVANPVAMKVAVATNDRADLQCRAMKPLVCMVLFGAIHRRG